LSERDSDSEGVEELEAYRKRASEILKERESRFKDLEGELLKLNAELQRSKVHRLARFGHIGEIMSGESHREKLREKKQDLDKQLNDLRAEISNANERLAMLDYDIKQLTDKNSLKGT
jgi:predicted  nucleic acid-binding Zn-ribbon protein